MTRIVAIVLLATVSLQGNTLKDASHWPDLVYSAKQRGIDYPGTVARARHGDPAALATLFRHTPHTDGSAADSHCVVLRKLLEILGDRKFSSTLRHEPASLRSRVTEALDFDFGHPWQTRFPFTYALGAHDTRLLKPRMRPNQALERTADRREDLLSMTSTVKPETQLGSVSRRSAPSR
jgi:hypothetical protein